MSFITDILTQESANSFEVITTNLDSETKEKLNAIFPEKGFQSYFPNWLLVLFFEYLEQQGITSLQQRVNHPELASIQAVLKDFKAHVILR